MGNDGPSSIAPRLSARQVGRERGSGCADLEAAGSHFEVERRYADYREFLAAGELDGVVTSVPHVFHYEIARDALDAKIHLVLVKPMTSKRLPPLEPAEISPPEAPARCLVDLIPGRARTLPRGRRVLTRWSFSKRCTDPPRKVVS